MEKMYTITDESGVKHEMSRHHFQVLHSAGRALLRQAIQTYDHSTAATAYISALDEAVQVGHGVLNTSSPSADEYVRLVSNISNAHRDQAQAILAKEGLLPKEE